MARLFFFFLLWSNSMLATDLFICNGPEDKRLYLSKKCVS